MDELRWIKVSLCLVVVLQSTAVTGQSTSYLAVRAGDDVTLSCKHLIDGQRECDRTDWIFSGSTYTHLVGRGQIVVEDNPRSDRLSLTENCSLVLKKVSDGDVGRFDCQQIRSGKISHSTLIGVSVVSMTEHDDGDEVTLTCFVSALRDITHIVQWLHEGRAVGGNTNMKSATVTFPSSDLRETKFYQCEVTVGKGHVFTFPAPTSGEEPDVDTTTTTNGGKPGTEPTSPPDSNTSPPTSVPGGDTTTTTTDPHTTSEALLRLIIVSVGLMALIITVVTVNVWTRAKGNKKQTNDNVNSDEDEDDGAVNYENVNQSS